jgi:hypothetical protein
VSVTPPAIAGDTGWYDSGGAVTATYDRAWNITPQQSRTVATGYSVNGGNITVISESGDGTFIVQVTMNSPQTVSVNSMTQYYTSFNFANASGSKAITPTDLQISINGQVQGIAGFGIWLNNGTTFTISELTYEGVDVKPSSQTQYSVAGSNTITLKALVYDASVKVTDFLGLPVSGAHVIMTLANGTAVSGTTNGDGVFATQDIPLGTFTAKISSLGSPVQISGDASKQSLTTALVLFSATSLTLVVAVVIAGAGAMTFLLRRRSKN